MQVAVHRTKFCRVYTIHRAAERAALLNDTSKLFSPKGSGEGISSGRLTEPPHPALPGGAAQGLGTQPTSSPDPWAAEIPSGGQRLCWRGSVAWRCSPSGRHGGFPHADGSRAMRWGGTPPRRCWMPGLPARPHRAPTGRGAASGAAGGLHAWLPPRLRSVEGTMSEVTQAQRRRKDLGWALP